MVKGRCQRFCQNECRRASCSSRQHRTAPVFFTSSIFSMMSGMTRASLTKRCEAGEDFKYVVFWNNEWKCLSQFYEAAFTIDGIRYRTAEHFYMAEKARMFNDEDSLARILASDTPKKAKRIGSKVKAFDRDRWLANDHARNVAVRGNMAKFSDPENADIRELLLSTGDAVLAEGSPNDTTWGIGMYPDDDRAKIPQEWKGENLLGFALMDARQSLRDDMTRGVADAEPGGGCVDGVT